MCVRCSLLFNVVSQANPLLLRKFDPASAVTASSSLNGATTTAAKDSAVSARSHFTPPCHSPPLPRDLQLPCLAVSPSTPSGDDVVSPPPPRDLLFPTVSASKAHELASVELCQQYALLDEAHRRALKEVERLRRKLASSEARKRDTEEMHMEATRAAETRDGRRGGNKAVSDP